MSTTSDDHIALALRRSPPALPQSPHSGRRGVRAPARILPRAITHRPHRVPAIALTQRPHPGDKSASPIPCAACCVAPRSRRGDLCAAQICALASLQLAVTRRRALGPRLGEILASCRVPAPHSSDLLHCLAAGCRPPSSGRPRDSLPPRPSLRTTRSASILPSPPPSPLLHPASQLHPASPQEARRLRAASGLARVSPPCCSSLHSSRPTSDPLISPPPSQILVSPHSWKCEY